MLYYAIVWYSILWYVLVKVRIQGVRAKQL